MDDLPITTYINYEGTAYYIPADCEFNHSNAWDTVEKRATDNTKTIHNVTVLRTRGRQPHMYTLTFNIYQRQQTTSIWNLLKGYEELVGKQVDLLYLNMPFLGLVITDGTFAFTNDGAQGVIALTITYNFRESTIVTVQNRKVKTVQG